ncbi:GHKL domain-containing protein [Limosilactobacillus sp. Lr3000]|uniref:GHKL domain-containing protein n=1 Tax=Limosilactobacillus albertensis TaxID=2759752 RepID=A0A839HBG9_9LACO|nr:GHKL domain-containing protein [Limosilactobacillus albertensis]MBB1124249.1 GHKL domain-containing protein [Limosilactobacillus albertensis]
MITLSVAQSFVSEFLQIFETLIIYYLLLYLLSLKKIIVIGLTAFVIVSIPLTVGSLYSLLLVIILWLFDRVKDKTNIIINNILAMITSIIMSSLFDLVDHYTYALFLQGKSNIFILGWLIPFNDLLVTIIFGIIVIKLIRPRLTWFIVNFPRPVRLWKITSIYFLLYIWLTVVAEKDGIANEYAPLMLIMYLIIIFVGGIGFVSFIRSNAKAQRQQQLINSYQNQIATAQKVNAQYEDLRRERHDMKNMLLSVQGYIRDHNDEKANQLLSTFLQTNIDSKNYEEIDNSLSRLNISGLRNLIKEKAYRIVEQEIPLAIEVNAKIDSLPGSEVKTARIIGILLDNAIEATSNQKKPYIQVALLRHDEENYELVVANSLEKTLDLNKAMKFEHSEKENHQGIGLSNITQLVDNDDRYSFSAEVKEKVIIMTCFIQGK